MKEMNRRIGWIHIQHLLGYERLEEVEAHYSDTITVSNNIVAQTPSNEEEFF